MGRPSLPNAVRISKQLTQILRHCGRKDGLQVRSDGFTLLEDLLQLQSMRKLKATEPMVREIVQTNDKQRFALSTDSKGQLMIRANQGHSMDGIDMAELCGSPLHELNPGEVCCHGTYEKHLPGILKHGLKAGGNQGQAFRKDVHFSVRRPGEEVVSGMRYNCQVAIYIDLPRAARAGVRFYRSANDVILSPGVNGAVPAEFIESIWNIQSGVQAYPPAYPAVDGDPSSACQGSALGIQAEAGSGGSLDELHNALATYMIYGCIHEL